MNHPRDQRTFERFQVDMPIWVRLQEQRGEFKLLETANISAGGLLFHLDYELTVGSLLELRFELPQDNDLVKAVAEIRHVEQEADERYLIGVTFLEVKNHAVPALLAYLEAIFK